MIDNYITSLSQSIIIVIITTLASPKINGKIQFRHNLHKLPTLTVLLPSTFRSPLHTEVTHWAPFIGSLNNFSKFIPAIPPILSISKIAEMSKDRQLRTLSELYKESERDAKSGKETGDRYFSSVGLVVDCSNVFRYENNRDFTQKLKIIDASSPDSPMQVFLYSNRKDDFSLNVKIGDILLINRFRIEIYNGGLQAKKAFKVEDSYFRIFNGQPDLNNYSPIDKKVGLDDEDGSILTALLELRKFSRNYFKSNKVPLLFKQ